MWYVVGGVCLSVVAGFVAAGLLVQRARLRRVEAEWRESLRERRRMTGRLIAAQEGERRRIARELHDDLGQGLALLAIDVNLLSLRPPPSAEESAERLRGLSDQVRALSSAVHALSHQLHPSGLEKLGLVGAVRGLCLELGRHHALQVDFAHAGVPRRVPPDAALCLYRVAQEALRNVVRHSGAGRATVRLTGTPAGLRLVVADGGVGFDLTAARSNGGLGLVSMRERIDLGGGELTIDTRPAGGTRIDVRLPAALPIAAADEPGTVAWPEHVVGPAPVRDAPGPDSDGFDRIPLCVTHRQSC